MMGKMANSQAEFHMKAKKIGEEENMDQSLLGITHIMKAGGVCI